MILELVAVNARYGNVPVLREIFLGVNPGEVPWAWSQDEKSLYVMEKFILPARVYRVHWETGERNLWKEIAFPDPAGVMGIMKFVMTPDGQSYAYDYMQQLSTLHIVDGLK